MTCRDLEDQNKGYGTFRQAPWKQYANSGRTQQTVKKNKAGELDLPFSSW